MKNKKITTAAILATSFFLTACGGGGSGGDDSEGGAPPPAGTALNAGAGAPTGAEGSCGATTTGVNWDALMTEICPKLSDYNLFADATDPTTAPARGGVPYDLSTALFSDYTSKYRFIFVPEGKTISYNASEVLEFPVGTVITKTFALPENTAVRDGEELVIETRLLIHRSDGWFALPYYWSSDSDAVLAIAGKRLTDLTTINNQGQQITFDYSVPKAGDCSSCHSIVPNLSGSGDDREQIFLPIGPKARYLNKDYAYADGTVYNQLQFMAEGELLTGLPFDLQTVEKAPVFNDQVPVASLAPSQLDDAARAYLDINCAHCHRADLTLPTDYAGPAGSSGVQLEYNRDYADSPGKFGVCKTPVAGGKDGYPFDVIPGNAAESYLLFRMTTDDNRHKMPELARNTAHLEGTALIRSWIDQLPVASCSPVP
ncbi:SO2930 family diheme c-type cytochrome [Marinobacter sp. 1_MG-2023]|uniref:SO2930 family diheme c-type cytochrome n=1 Tax=Marinobacter sp. 1_MG-2023 TaxID=3062627 RepID=UPI0026E36513|nr:SO2930 family diheme c-type cytochrome [Marinobacter sp. 1_MG-2023]MDO6824250.1 SO2930 family diheme c-type cytochrome [Marinobacter sp. 1_MG-2023]